MDFKKFFANKNTVTILGVVVCVLVLYFGYNYRINQKVTLVNVLYAKQTIQPKTLITEEMVATMSVPTSFLTGTYYNDKKDVIGKYSNYNTMIAEGSLFYTDLVVSKSDLPDAAFSDVPKGYTVVNYGVNMQSTYANSMMPGNYINIYYKGRNDEGKVQFGKFITQIEILDVKDASGRHVFETTEEARTPAFMLFAVPEDIHLLLRKALYLADAYDIELILIPNTEVLKDEDSVNVTSEDIKKFINEKTAMVDVTDLPSLDSAADSEEEDTTEEPEAEPEEDTEYNEYID